MSKAYRVDPEQLLNRLEIELVVQDPFFEVDDRLDSKIFDRVRQVAEHLLLSQRGGARVPPLLNSCSFRIDFA